MICAVDYYLYCTLITIYKCSQKRENNLQNSSQSLHTGNDRGAKKALQFAIATNWLEIKAQRVLLNRHQCSPILPFLKVIPKITKLNRVKSYNNVTHNQMRSSFSLDKKEKRKKKFCWFFSKSQIFAQILRRFARLLQIINNSVVKKEKFYESGSRDKN